MKTIAKNIMLTLLVFSCSSNNQDLPPDQYGGDELINSLSNMERKLIGTWYFAYEIFELKNGSDSIVNHSGIDYGNLEVTDTLKFYSTEFVGFDDVCPMKSPDSLDNKLKTYYFQTAYFLSCFPTYNGGWYIENDNLVNYWGVPDTFETPIEYFEIESITNDSLVFVYKDSTNINLLWAKKRTPVFYRKE